MWWAAFVYFFLSKLTGECFRSSKTVKDFLVKIWSPDRTPFGPWELSRWALCSLNFTSSQGSFWLCCFLLPLSLLNFLPFKPSEALHFAWVRNNEVNDIVFFLLPGVYGSLLAHHNELTTKKLYWFLVHQNIFLSYFTLANPVIFIQIRKTLLILLKFANIYFFKSLMWATMI